MSNVIQLFGGGEPPSPEISFDELAAQAGHPSMTQYVQFSINDTIKVNHPKIKAATPTLRRVEPHRGEDAKFGILMPYARIEGLIITNENYPNYLLEEGLSRQDALNLAASSLVAYASVHRWMSGLNSRDKVKLTREASQNHMLPQHPALWTTESYNRGLRLPNAHNIMHRIAARIALNCCDIEALDPSATPPYPDHIAALADPYENAEIGGLYATTTSH
jgi:hypothetical protein